MCDPIQFTCGPWTGSSDSNLRAQLPLPTALVELAAWGPLRVSLQRTQMCPPTSLLSLLFSCLQEQVP